MIGILCGLQDEEKIARQIDGALIACSAAVPQKARTLARGLIGQGATRLMSFGVAGALASHLPVGALIIGSKVLSPEGTWDCDAAWADDLARHLPLAERGMVWGSEVLVPLAAEKIALHRHTKCAIVDMESQCAAEVAAEAGVPLAVVRVVCDTAQHNLPPLVMASINPDGSTNYKVVMKSLLREPRQVFDLIKVGRSMAKALLVLDNAARSL